MSQQIIIEGYYPFGEDEIKTDSYVLPSRTFKLYSKRHNKEDLAPIGLKRVFRKFMQVIEVYGVVDLKENGYFPFFVTDAVLETIKS
jgi:hypothetical protein